MSKNRILRLKPVLRLKWRDQHGQSKTDKRDHRANLADSIIQETRIRFSVHTTGTIEEDDDKLEQAVTNIAPTSLKRLVGRQAVIKTGHKPECRLGAQ